MVVVALGHWAILLYTENPFRQFEPLARQWWKVSNNDYIKWKCDTPLCIILLFTTQRKIPNLKRYQKGNGGALQSPSTVKNECSNLINFNDTHTHGHSHLLFAFSHGFTVRSFLCVTVSSVNNLGCHSFENNCFFPANSTICVVLCTFGGQCSSCCCCRHYYSKGV